MAGATGVAGAIALRSNAASGRTLVEDISTPAIASASELPRRVKSPVHRLPGWTAGRIGTSLLGRPIERLDTRPANPKRHVVVVCGVHGDERAAEDLAKRFGAINRPTDLHLTIIPMLNPDGWEAGTRRNGRGVDLNRNFPWGWPNRPDSGAYAGSEPETIAIMDFLRRTKPDLVVWVHQPLGYVAALPGCPPWYADIWADFAPVPVRRNLTQIGGGETWTAMELGRPSMLIEVDGSRETPRAIDEHASALEALIFAVQPV